MGLAVDEGGRRRGRNVGGQTTTPWENVNHNVVCLIYRFSRKCWWRSSRRCKSCGPPCLEIDPCILITDNRPSPDRRRYCHHHHANHRQRQHRSPQNATHFESQVTVNRGAAVLTSRSATGSLVLELRYHRSAPAKKAGVERVQNEFRR